jgi:ribosome-associated protein YbcJ (S4-like RNA binding protein)
MPRQFPLEKSLGDFLAVKSPVPSDHRRLFVGKKIAQRSDDGVLNDLSLAAAELTKTKMMSEMTKKSSLNDLCHALLFSMGAGVINEIPEQEVIIQPNMQKTTLLKTDFSLLKIETDKTVIANPNIIDIKSVNKQFTNNLMIPAQKVFSNLEKDPFYQALAQGETKEVIKKMRILKSKTSANTIDLTFQILKLQKVVSTGKMLKSFRHSKQVKQNPDVTETNHEFKDFSNPQIRYLAGADIQKDLKKGTN